MLRVLAFFFFFQAEDGIRDKLVTGVQTCALPIWRRRAVRLRARTSPESRGRSALPIAAEPACFCANRAADRVREPAALRAEREPDVAVLDRRLFPTRLRRNESLPVYGRRCARRRRRQVLHELAFRPAVRGTGDLHADDERHVRSEERDTSRCVRWSLVLPVERTARCGCRSRRRAGQTRRVP